MSGTLSYWYFLTDILGNAYISLFFTCGQNPQMSQQALSAYAQAVSEYFHTHTKLGCFYKSLPGQYGQVNLILGQ